MIEELKRTDLNCNVFNVYDYDGLTMQELLGQFFTKINECIKVSNNTIELSTWLVNEGLKKETAEKLMLWLNDGTLENIINENIFNSLYSEINKFKNGIKIIDDSMTIHEINNLLNLKGTFLFKSGEYNLFKGDSLNIKSDSHIIFESGAILKQNSLDDTHYNMILINQCKNVVLDNVFIVGERDYHKGTLGEWGHGITVYMSENIIINNPNISKTWGDGIYIGYNYDDVAQVDKNKNIVINNPYIDSCSRNGISICSSSDVKVYNAIIKNIDRTPPMSGIDIEPEHSTHEGIVLGDVLIDNLRVYNSTIGISMYLSKTYNGNGNINLSNIYVDDCSQGCVIRGLSHECNYNININKIDVKNQHYNGLLLNNISENINIKIKEINVGERKFSNHSDSGEYGSCLWFTSSMGEINSIGKIEIDNITISDKLNHYANYIRIDGIKEFNNLYIDNIKATPTNNYKLPYHVAKLGSGIINKIESYSLCEYQTPIDLNRLVFNRKYVWSDLQQETNVKIDNTMPNGDYTFCINGKVVPHSFNINLLGLKCIYDIGEYTKITSLKNGSRITLTKEGDKLFVSKIIGEWNFI